MQQIVSWRTVGEESFSRPQSSILCCYNTCGEIKGYFAAKQTHLAVPPIVWYRPNPPPAVDMQISNLCQGIYIPSESHPNSWVCYLESIWNYRPRSSIFLSGLFILVCGILLSISSGWTGREIAACFCFQLKALGVAKYTSYDCNFSFF